MAGNSTHELTIGNPMKLILSFMLPLLLGMIFQQFYNMVDTIVVGKFLGVQALAGVGSTGSISFLVLGMCNGICAGFAIPVAQKFGQADYDGLRKLAGNIIWLGSILAVAITFVTVCLCRNILIWMRTPEDVFQYAYQYIFLIFLGIPATILYNLTAGVLRSLGDSRTPLYFLVLSSLLNIVLDIICILQLNMGVAGAGWATLISQLISGLLCLHHIMKYFPILKLKRSDFRLEGHCVCRLLAMGLPMGLQYSITAIGSILLQTAVNSLGSVFVAATTASGKVGAFAVCPFEAVGSTAATFAAQNIGAGKPERVHKGVQDAAMLGFGYSLIIFVVLFFFGEDMAMLFLDSKDMTSVTTILPLARENILWSASFYTALLFVNLLRFTIQGLGFSNLAVIAGILEMFARGFIGIYLVPHIGFTAACLSSPAAWIMADIFLYPAYWYCLKKKGFQREKPNAPLLKSYKIRRV